ncbi:hypothetical protein OQA88_10382 [Cercophora sp. LCS_1]
MPRAQAQARARAFLPRPTHFNQRQRQRPLSTSAAGAGAGAGATAVRAPEAPVPAGLAPLPSRRLLSVAGPDAPKFLQRMVTNDLTTPGTVHYAGLLNAHGRVLHDLFIYNDLLNIGGRDQPDPAENYLLEVDADEAKRLEKLIKFYKLKAKLDVRVLDPEQARVWQVWGGGGDESVPNGMVVRDGRAPAMGFRVLTAGQKPQVEVDEVGEEMYTLRRYLHGVAEGQREILNGSLPLESNLDLCGGVGFRKGCYIGQELTIRTKHRGVVRKRILPCVLYGEGEERPTELAYKPTFGKGLDAGLVGAETSIQRVAKKGRSPGKWLKGIGNVGLALCRLEIMTDVTLPGEEPGESFQPDAEFSLVAGGDEGTPMRIKAFVPEWVRKGVSEDTH